MHTLQATLNKYLQYYKHYSTSAAPKYLQCLTSTQVPTILQAYLTSAVTYKHYSTSPTPATYEHYSTRSYKHYSTGAAPEYLQC